MIAVIILSPLFIFVIISHPLLEQLLLGFVLLDTYPLLNALFVVLFQVLCYVIESFVPCRIEPRLELNDSFTKATPKGPLTILPNLAACVENLCGSRRRNAMCLQVDFECFLLR